MHWVHIVRRSLEIDDSGQAVQGGSPNIPTYPSAQISHIVMPGSEVVVPIGQAWQPGVKPVMLKYPAHMHNNEEKRRRNVDRKKDKRRKEEKDKEFYIRNEWRRHLHDAIII